MSFQEVVPPWNWEGTIESWSSLSRKEKQKKKGKAAKQKKKNKQFCRKHGSMESCLVLQPKQKVKKKKINRKRRKSCQAENDHRSLAPSPPTLYPGIRRQPQNVERLITETEQFFQIS